VLDLCVDVTELVLSIANCCVGGYFGLSQPHHLLRPLVLCSGAIEREYVAVAAMGVGSVRAQPWQRSRQFTASLLY
jgi:hypothetical protein